MTGCSARSHADAADVRCPTHPTGRVRHFRADGPGGRGIYAFCLPTDGAMHLLPTPREPEPETLGQALAERRRRRSGADDAERDTRGLSAPELDVLHAAARGLTVIESAHQLGKGSETVKSQRNSVILKLGARNITHAVYLATSEGLVTAP